MIANLRVSNRSVQMVNQNLGIATILAVLAGVLNVIAVAVVVIANNRTKAGQKGKEEVGLLSQCCQIFVVIANLFFQLMNSIAAVGAALYGPVSIVVPVILSSQLVFNMVMFGPLLRIEKFPKEVRAGTYTVVIAAILLPVVGPTVQENQDIMELIAQPRSVILIIINGTIILLAFPLMILENNRFARVKASDSYVGDEYSTLSFITNVLTQSISQVIQSTAAKMFALVTVPALATAVVVFAILTFTQSVAILQQGTTVKQSTFIPMNTMATIFLNAVFGIIIWEDWKVVQSWIGYSLVLLQVVLGNYLLSDFDFFDEIAQEKANANLVSAETVQNLGKVPVEEETGMMRSGRLPSIKGLQLTEVIEEDFDSPLKLPLLSS